MRFVFPKRNLKLFSDYQEMRSTQFLRAADMESKKKNTAGQDNYF